MASFYDIDFGLVAERIIPPYLRKPVWLAWLRSILKPLQQLRDNIFTVYAETGGVDFTTGETVVGLRERMKYNSQTIVLEAILNKKFAVTSAPFIYIENFTGDADIVYLTDSFDGAPREYVGDPPNDSETMFLGSEEDYLPLYDFIVWVPSAVYATLGTSNPERTARVATEVEKYKVLGVNYSIQTY